MGPLPRKAHGFHPCVGDVPKVQGESLGGFCYGFCLQGVFRHDGTASHCQNGVSAVVYGNGICDAVNKGPLFFQGSPGGQKAGRKLSGKSWQAAGFSFGLRLRIRLRGVWAGHILSPPVSVGISPEGRPGKEPGEKRRRSFRR